MDEELSLRVVETDALVLEDVSDIIDNFDVVSPHVLVPIEAGDLYFYNIEAFS